MNRKTWTIFLLGLTAMVLLAQYALTQGCTPGYSNGSMSMGDIQSLCAEPIPAPQTRTTVGIGEVVSCWIDSSSFSATAVYTDQYCNQSPAEDGLGSLTWTVSGQGTIYPSVTYDFSPVTLSIDLADADNVVTVYVTGTDALAVDPPVQKQKAFNAKVPTGANCYYVGDVAIGVLGPPNNQIGGQTVFNVQVLPANVDFKALNFRENIPQQNWTWNDGTKDTLGAQIVAYNVASNKDNPPTPNWTNDTIQLGLRPIARLAGKNETVTWKIPQEYQDANGAWKQFLAAETHVFVFDGAKATCTITDNCTNSASGQPQGPWR